MLVCLALLGMMIFGNAAQAATAPVDTVTAEAETVTTIKKILTAISEAKIELDLNDENVELRSVDFSYADANYKQVMLTGSFTGWVRLPMKKEGSNWVLTIAVPNTQQHYHFSVISAEETWDAIDPENTLAINHENFGWVSILDSGPGGDNRELKARKAKRQQRRKHRRLVRAELETGQGITEDVSYQRVDGLVFNPAVTRISDPDKYDLSVRLHGNYGFSSGRFGGGLTVLKPLVLPYALGLKLSLFDRTMPNNYNTGIGNTENSLAAFFLHEDYRDYHGSKGLNASLVFKLGQWFRLEGGIIKEDHSSLSAPSVWAAKKGDFIPNPLINDGRMSSVFFNVGLGGKNSHLMATYERSGEEVIGGDFEFERITAKLRGRWELGPYSGFDARLAFGRNLQGELPTQRRFLLGGLGTVRGYGYQSLLIEDPNRDPLPAERTPYGGEQSALGNLEYYFALADDFQMSIFYDAGMVWQDSHAELSLDQLKSSVGIGFKFDSDEGPRIDLIQRLDEPKDPYVVQFRLKRTF